jgi:hypothetical protein
MEEASDEAVTSFGQALTNAFIEAIEGEAKAPLLIVEGIPLGESLAVEGRSRFKKDILNLIYALPLFNPKIVQAVEQLVRKKSLSGDDRYIALPMAFLDAIFKFAKCATVDKRKAFLSWVKDPASMGMVKLVMTGLIDLLAESDPQKRRPEEEIQAYAKSLKANVLLLLPLLEGKAEANQGHREDR